MIACSRYGYLFVLVAYFFSIFIHSTSGQRNYCSICLDHTMCLYPENRPSAQCRQYARESMIMNQGAISIVNEHNALRSKVAEGRELSGNPGPQPSASNMKIMKWDNELATIAQRWADQCIFSHDACRNTDVYVGQNIYMSCSSAGQTNVTINDVLQAWYNEVARFNRENISPYRYFPNQGEYAQMVWADTRLVGCGGVRYLNVLGQRCLLVVCNYSPGGNIISGSMYKFGLPGADCPSGVSNESYSLCN